jgi:hypothetical protein
MKKVENSPSQLIRIQKRNVVPLFFDQRNEHANDADKCQEENNHNDDNPENPGQPQFFGQQLQKRPSDQGKDSGNDQVNDHRLNLVEEKQNQQYDGNRK